MKKQLLFLLTLCVFLASCHQDGEFFDDFTDDSSTQVDDPQDGEDGQGAEGSLTLYKVNGDGISKIKDYPVGADLRSYQQDEGKHTEMWAFVSRLIPLAERDKIAEFEVFYGGDQLAGYVAPVDDNDLSKWRFGLAIEIANQLATIDFNELFTYVTIHEYGHVLTLNDEQIQLGSPDNCGSYFTGEGCSNHNSYINRLYELGWKDIYHELNHDDPYVLYNKYPDRFVTDYAATNPGEDIAEVFSFFITKAEQPTGNTIADQKIRLLYEFPELVKLREEIRGNGNVEGLQAGSWRSNPRLANFRLCSRKGCKH